MSRLFIIIGILLVLASPAIADVSVTISGASRVSTVGDNVTVSLPFEEEYTVNLCNHHDRLRALVTVHIDGRPATGKGLILVPGETVALERFIDDDLQRGSRFLFIEAPARAGNDAGSMLITVQYERDTAPLLRYREPPVQHWGGWDGGTAVGSLTYITTDASASLTTASVSHLVNGVTIPGSESRQRFEYADIDDLDPRQDVMAITMRGFYRGQPITLKR